MIGAGAPSGSLRRRQWAQWCVVVMVALVLVQAALQWVPESWLPPSPQRVEEPRVDAGASVPSASSPNPIASVDSSASQVPSPVQPPPNAEPPPAPPPPVTRVVPPPAELRLEPLPRCAVDSEEVSGDLRAAFELAEERGVPAAKARFEALVGCGGHVALAAARGLDPTIENDGVENLDLAIRYYAFASRSTAQRETALGALRVLRNHTRAGSPLRSAIDAASASSDSGP
jgi:hypothetical protein